VEGHGRADCAGGELGTSAEEAFGRGRADGDGVGHADYAVGSAEV
jgi:hypothetical protein